jgi:hypothetical protein
MQYGVYFCKLIHVFNVYRRYYGIDDAFQYKQMFTRTADGRETKHSRSVYFVNDIVRQVLQNNDNLKVVFVVYLVLFY